MISAPIGMSEQLPLHNCLLSRLAKTLKWLFVCGLILFAAIAVAHAQVPEDVEARKLDEIAANLQRIDSTLQGHDLTDQDLQSLRDQLTPLGVDVDKVIGRLTPRLAAVNTRLEQLGALPDAKAPPEDPQVTADRAEQQKTHDAIDALLKRGNLLAVQIEQGTTQISARRRALFTRSLFERSPSLVSPDFWYRIAVESPRDIQLARNLILDLAESVGGKLAGWRLPAFTGLLALVVILCWPLSAMARWVRSRERSISEPTPLNKFVAAWWITFVVVSLPLAALFAIGGLLQVFDLLDPRLETLTRTLAEGVGLIALTAGIGRGLLSPEHANWRIIRLSDDASEYVLRLAVAVAVVVTFTRIDEAIVETVGASAALQTAIRGIGALIVGLVIGVGLWRFGTKQHGNEDVFGPLVAPQADWSGPIRIVCWGVAAAIIISALAGFLVFAGFLADQIVWVTGVATIALMASGLVDAGVAAGCRPSTPFGRNVAAIIGLSQRSLEQLSILIGGAIRVIAFIIALFLILAPWGLQSADMPSYFRAAFFGFKVDDVRISLASIGLALAIFAAGYAITRTFVRWLDTSYLPHTSLDLGFRNAIKTSLGYVGISVSVLISLAYVGVSFEKLA
ncbi:MAG: DUF3772 domain-containing protein, partial [Beijerinckiaceae bacterium]